MRQYTEEGLETRSRNKTHFTGKRKEVLISATEREGQIILTMRVFHVRLPFLKSPVFPRFKYMFLMKPGNFGE